MFVLFHTCLYLVHVDNVSFHYINKSIHLISSPGVRPLLAVCRLLLAIARAAAIEQLLCLKTCLLM